MFATSRRVESRRVASIGVYFDVMWLTFLGISILIQYMYNDNACLDLLLAFFMLFASIHLGSTTNISSSSRLSSTKRKWFASFLYTTNAARVAPVRRRRGSCNRMAERRRRAARLDVFAAGLTLKDHHNGQRGTRNIQIAGIKMGPGSWHKSKQVKPAWNSLS